MTASPSTAVRRRVAVVGGGWAGIAAAVEACRAGADVTLFEMAPRLGGRARRVDVQGLPLDNGQHILIGAYRETLDLMRLVGVDTADALLRLPLTLLEADGRGLRLGRGPAAVAFAAAVLGMTHWRLSERAALLRAAAGWAARGFRCNPSWTVAQLVRRLPPRVVTELIDPLCVAALNTAMGHASATVFLRVLRDALFGGRGGADLLIPRRDLSSLLPDPAAGWLAARGVTLRLQHRVDDVAAAGGPGDGWRVDGDAFDRLVLALPAGEAARLAEPHNPDWAATARALCHEPIATLYARAEGARLPWPLIAMRHSSTTPAQYVFDRGALSDEASQHGVLAFVVSDAAAWTARGSDALTEAVLAQARQELAAHLPHGVEPLRLLIDKRATFACTPGLRRPAARLATDAWAAADYVEGPYPATLEGAVRHGRAAGRAAADVATGTASG